MDQKDKDLLTTLFQNLLRENEFLLRNKATLLGLTSMAQKKLVEAEAEVLRLRNIESEAAQLRDALAASEKENMMLRGTY